MKYIIRLLQKEKHIFINQYGKPAPKKHIEYAKTLVIPPAYPFSIIFLEPSHILSVSYDDKGRKQYKYTQEFLDRNSIAKYKNLKYFIKHIQKIINVSKKDANSGCENALIVRILLECYLRIGSKEGVDKYQHYGISTLQKKHIRFGKQDNKNVAFISFIGKKGIQNDCILKENNTIKRLKELCKNKKNKDFIFNNASPVSVNEYLQKIYPTLSSKMIRTYGANYLLLKSLRNIDLKKVPNSERQKTILLNQHIDNVSCKLQNTKAILKTNYIIPKILELFIQNHKYFLSSLKKKSINSFMISLL